MSFYNVFNTEMVPTITTAVNTRKVITWHTSQSKRKESKKGIEHFLKVICRFVSSCAHSAGNTSTFSNTVLICHCVLPLIRSKCVDWGHLKAGRKWRLKQMKPFGSQFSMVEVKEETKRWKFLLIFPACSLRTWFISNYSILPLNKVDFSIFLLNS